MFARIAQERELGDAELRDVAADIGNGLTSKPERAVSNARLRAQLAVLRFRAVAGVAITVHTARPVLGAWRDLICDVDAVACVWRVRSKVRGIAERGVFVCIAARVS